MICQEFRESLQTTLDATPDVVLSRESETHVESCPDCRAFYESTLALHRALYQLPRVRPSQDLVAALNRIDQLDFVPVKLSWGPEIRLAAEMLVPVVLAYGAQLYSSELLQHILEASMLALGLTFFGIAVSKPYVLGAPEFRLSPEGH